MGKTFIFLALLGAVYVLKDLYKLFVHLKILRTEEYHWFWWSYAKTCFVALSNADPKKRLQLLEEYKAKKTFNKKQLVEKLVLIGKRSSEITDFHLALFELLAEYGDLTKSQRDALFFAYEQLPLSEKDFLIDLLQLNSKTPQEKTAV